MTDDATEADTETWTREEPPRSVPGIGPLNFLISDAAARAAAMLAGDPAASGAGGDPLVDAVRMLASPEGAAFTEAAAERTGHEPVELRRMVLAYTRGGTGAVTAAAGANPCGGEEMDAAVAEIRRRRTLAVGDLEVSPGSVTDPGAGIRVRLGPDRRWHPFTSARGEWWPASGASESAGAAYESARRARSRR